jgi:hypothetical protein
MGARPGAQHRLVFYLSLAVAEGLAVAGGCYLGGVGIAGGQDSQRAVACFVLAALAVIVADMLRPRKPSYR